MPDRDEEERHLQEADRHVADAHRLMGQLEILIEGGRQRGSDVGPACRALHAMQEVLDTFLAHRALIRQTIADIDAGKL